METPTTVGEPKSLVSNLRMTAAKQIVAKQKKSPKAKGQKTPNVPIRVIASLRVAKKQKLVLAVVAWLQKTNVDVFGRHPRAMYLWKESLERLATVPNLVATNSRAR